MSQKGGTEVNEQYITSSTSSSGESGRIDAAGGKVEAPASTFAQPAEPFVEFHLGIGEEELDTIQEHLNDRTVEEWIDILKEALEQHDLDPLIPEHLWKFLQDLPNGPTTEQTEDDWEYFVRFYGFLFHEWSIYPEVRMVTKPIDEEPDEDYNNIRVLVIGCCWGWAGAVLSTFFFPRFPSISIGNLALQVIIAGSGQLWALLPRITMPYWKGKRIVWNSGKPWTFKEQMLATLTMSVSNGTPYAAYSILAQSNDFFYGFREATQFGYMILFVISSTTMGFGFAGIFRSFLVYPSRMVWFDVLPFMKLARSLTSRETRTKTNGWPFTTHEFFWLFTVFWFGWYYVVNTGATFLQYFNWMAWIKPDNVNLNAITGSINGLGLNPVGSFDPNIVNSMSGVFIPIEAYCNWIFGYFVSFIGIVIMWWTNVRYTGYLPINSNQLFDNTGQAFNVSQVLDPQTLELDMDKYQSYSLPFWSAGLVLTYGANFMIYTAMVVYAALYYHGILVASIKGFVKGFKRGATSLSHFQDTFSRRQQRYKEVPEWWFLVVLAGSIGMAIGVVEGYKFTNTPVWSIFLGVGIGAVFIPLSGILEATTTYYFETNVLMELIMGYALPGNPNASMVSKVFATNFFGQTDNWISNQKQAHYSGIAPRALFWNQMISTIGACFVEVGLMTWQVNGGIRDMCDPTNVHLFNCQNPRTYFNASVLWGTIGPARVFKGLYPTMKWTFLIGAVYPLPFWFARKILPLLAKRTKVSPGSRAYWWISGEFMQHINEMVILSAPTSGWAPLNLTYYIGDFYICLLFNLYLKKKFPAWWRKYAYLFFAAMTNGYGWGGIIDFFSTQYNHIVVANWWGNSVNDKTSDALGTAVRLTLEPGDYFGPRKGHFPRS